MKQTPSDAGTAFLNLGLFSTETPLFTDADGDGYPDRIHLALAIAPGMDSGPVWAGLMNLAARLNIESCGRGIAPPVTRTVPEPGMLLVGTPSGRSGQAACLETDATGGWRLSGSSPPAMKRLLDTLAVADMSGGGQGIVRIELGGDGKGTCRMVRQDGTVFNSALPAGPGSGSGPVESEIPDRGRLTDLTSLADVLLRADGEDPRATRLALGLVLPETLSPVCGRALFSLIGEASARATELTLPLLPLLPLAGTCPGNAVCLAVEETREPGASLRRCDHGLKASGRPEDLAGLIRELTRLWFVADAPGGESLESWKRRLKGAAAVCRRPDRPEPKPDGKIIHRRMTLPGERRVLLAAAGRIPGGTGAVRCRAYAGGGVEARRALGRELDRLLKQKGYDPKTIVLRSHKPAVSWLLEEVEPSLPREVRSLQISVRPFDRPDQMECRTRWAQEMYPAPDIICGRRGWPVDRVDMALDENQAPAYLVRAMDGTGNVRREYELTPMMSELPYLLEGRDDQTAYPAAAGFEILKHGDVIRSCRVPTDREVFWRRFQENWLPLMETAMRQMLPGRLRAGALAFWEEIRIEVAIDEDQEALGLAQERIAPMEALHEDLYFGLLAFMESFRGQYCPDSRIQLGRVVPVMRPVRGRRPWARLRLKPLRRPLSAPQAPPVTDGISYARGLLHVDLPCELPDGAARERLCEAAKRRGYRLVPHGRGIRYTARPAPKAEAGPRTELLPGEAVPEPDAGAIPDGDTVREWIQRLAGRPGIRVWRAGKTLMGRDIHAVEAVAAEMHARRARLLKPTLLLNARHHANEVSGTNAAMKLLHTLACTESAGSILARANLAVVPLENGDGVATLEEMLPESPDHKLHAARYNALGLEWYDQYFDPDTPFSEARVKSRLFERWLPAYMIDLHGVPSHEWEQPFSGYLNPRFREHWIPRSFVYGILPFYRQAGHPGGKEAGILARKMSAALAAEPGMAALNREIFNRYERYAKAFEPELFDSDMAGSLVLVPTCDRIRKTNFGNRKWPLVKSEIVTEVLDEVARGPWLECCTRAHLAVIHALLAHMGQGAVAVLRRQRQDGRVTFAWERDQEKMSRSR